MDKQKHLYELASGFKFAMLVTQTPDGTLHARPMAVAELQPDADAYFATSLQSPKIAEIERHPEVLITFQSSNEYATIHGTARIVRDRAEIERLWSDEWRLWFPQGMDDPNLCLLRVTATQGEFWDTSGLEGVKFMFEGLKARIMGRTPEKNDVQHAKVQL